MGNSDGMDVGPATEAISLSHKRLFQEAEVRDEDCPKVTELECEEATMALGKCAEVAQQVSPTEESQLRQTAY